MIKQQIKNIFHKSVKSEYGQGLVEYALLLTLVGVISIGGLRLVGNHINMAFEDVNCGLDAEETGDTDCANFLDNSNQDNDNNNDDDNEEEEEEPCSTTDTPTFQAQCIGGQAYLTVTSTCEDVDSAELAVDPDGLLGLNLPLNVTLAKETDGLTLSASPISNLALCVGINTNTLSMVGTVFYNDGEIANLSVN